MGSPAFRTRCRLALFAVVVAVARGWGCGGPCLLEHCGPTPEECQAFNRTQMWTVDLRGAELLDGDSRRASVTPGLRIGCDDTIRSVDWSVQNPAVASVTPSGVRNTAQDTAGDIARAWVTGRGPGEATIGARIAFSDGSTLDARAAPLRVVAPDRPSRRSTVVTEGTVDVAFNQFTQYGAGGPIPLVVPGTGHLDILVDWPDFSATFSFFIYEGRCLTLPCTGRVIVDGSFLRHVKPRRETVRVEPGEASLAMWGVGTGMATVRYEARFTPD